jgi:hypothetical protein
MIAAQAPRRLDFELDAAPGGRITRARVPAGHSTSAFIIVGVVGRYPPGPDQAEQPRQDYPPRIQAAVRLLLAPIPIAK